MIDMPVEELPHYRPALTEPEDLDEFWRDTFTQSRAAAQPPTAHHVDSGLTAFDTFDVRFSGFAGQRIAAWLHIPRHVTTLPGCVIQYVGYGRGRGLAHEMNFWASAGYAHLVVDARGQGSIGEVGVTPDLDLADPAASGPSVPGFLTRGIATPQTYHYRRLITDAVLAVDACQHLPQITAVPITAYGISQGAGLAIAVAALHPGVALLLADVPFLVNIERAIAITDAEPYAEIVRYLSLHRDQREQVLDTLRHIDAAVLARRGTVPALFSVGLRDEISPPSTVFSAYNAWNGPKRIEEYPYNGHEGGGAVQTAVQLRWLARHS